MLSRLFLWGLEGNQKKYKQLFQRFKLDLNELVGLKEQQLTLMADSGYHRVRFEFFCKSKSTSFSDVLLPRVPIHRLIWVGDHERVVNHMMSEINAIRAPLRDLILHIESCEKRKIYGVRMWDELDEYNLGANRMTTLIYCLEKAIQFMNIVRNARHGVITKRLWEVLDSYRETSNEGNDDGQDIFFAIPEECVVKVEETQKFKMCLSNANIAVKTSNSNLGHQGNDHPWNSGEAAFPEAPDDSGNEEDIIVSVQDNSHHLLKNTLYSYKRVDLNTRLTDADLKRLPKHTQTLGGQMNKESILPKGEEHLKARIAQVFFEFTENQREKNRTVSYEIPMFQRRHYRYIRYKGKTPEQIKGLFDQLCKILWSSYDSSWCAAWKQRKWYREKMETGYSNNADMSLVNFPTTKSSFDRWHSSQLDVDSMMLVQSPMSDDWNSGTATVTTAQDLYKHCFEPSEKCLKGWWNKFLSVRLFKLICCILRDIHAFLRRLNDCNKETIDMWRIPYFREHLFRYMSKCRHRGEGDNSMFFVWDVRSEDKVYWDWRRIRPKLVMVCSPSPDRFTTSSSLVWDANTSIDSMEKYMFPFQTDAQKRKKSGSAGVKDKFYQIMLPSGMQVQLNDIIAARILLAMQKEFRGKPVNSKNCALHLTFNTRPKVLGKVFAYTKTSFPNKIKDMKKKINHREKHRSLIEYAMQNNSQWDRTENDKLIIFQDTIEEETRMKDLIAEKNISAVMKRAHKGVITEAFLDLLINLRDVYESIKHLPESQIKSGLERYLEV